MAQSTPEHHVPKRAIGRPILSVLLGVLALPLLNSNAQQVQTRGNAEVGAADSVQYVEELLFPRGIDTGASTPEQRFEWVRSVFERAEIDRWPQGSAVRCVTWPEALPPLAAISASRTAWPTILMRQEAWGCLRYTGRYLDETIEVQIQMTPAPRAAQEYALWKATWLSSSTSVPSYEGSNFGKYAAGDLNCGDICWSRKSGRSVTFLRDNYWVRVDASAGLADRVSEVTQWLDDTIRAAPTADETYLASHRPVASVSRDAIWVRSQGGAEAHPVAVRSTPNDPYALCGIPLEVAAPHGLEVWDISGKHVEAYPFETTPGGMQAGESSPKCVLLVPLATQAQHNGASVVVMTNQLLCTQYQVPADVFSRAHAMQTAHRAKYGLDNE